MFWGLVLEPGKFYSSKVNRSFHVSMAALDCSSVKKTNESLKVLLHTEGQVYILCNLYVKNHKTQAKLDLNFTVGDNITFECKGSGNVHLTGYLVPDDFEMETEEEDMDEEREEEFEESETDSPTFTTSQSKIKVNKTEKPKSGAPTPQQNKKNKMKKKKNKKNKKEDPGDGPLIWQLSKNLFSPD